MILLGQKVKDKVSGFEGIVLVITEAIGCCKQIGIQGPLDKDGMPSKVVYIDEPQLEVVDAKQIMVPDTKPFKFEFGQEAKCIVTGYQGKINGKAYHINGCNTYVIQRPFRGSKDDDLDTGNWFAEDAIVHVGKLKKKPEVESKTTGGPVREIPSNRPAR